MSNVGCYLYAPEEERLRDRVDRDGKVTDVFPSSEVSGRQLALVSWDAENIEAVAVMSVGGRVAAYKARVRFSNFFECDPVSLTELASRLPAADCARFKRVINGGHVGTKTTAALQEALAQHYPAAAKSWDLAAKEAVRAPPELWPDETEPVVAYEREAVGLALQIAGIDRQEVMSEWDGDTEAPFLRGLSEFRVYEDAAIVNDSQVFGNWRALAPSVIGVARFEAYGRRVTVVNANRTPIEKSLGCDLIYYTHDYNAHVLVQYKRLTKPAVGPWEFRPSSDANFEEELKRMRAIAAPARVKDTPEHHRFGDNFCFIKFCKAATSDPFSGELAAGMYLPLDYFDKLAEAGRLKGPRGGTVVNYDNVGRWLNNSAFVGLVERAWVGTRGLTSTQLTTVIRRSLAAKHSLILAEGDALPAGARR